MPEGTRRIQSRVTIRQREPVQSISTLKKTNANKGKAERRSAIDLRDERNQGEDM